MGFELPTDEEMASPDRLRRWLERNQPHLTEHHVRCPDCAAQLSITSMIGLPADVQLEFKKHES